MVGKNIVELAEVQLTVFGSELILISKAHYNGHHMQYHRALPNTDSLPFGQPEEEVMTHLTMEQMEERQLRLEYVTLPMIDIFLVTYPIPLMRHLRKSSSVHGFPSGKR